MKKTVASTILAFLAAARIFSLPGFSPFINDVPGEYVYYQDKTFERKSYIGFMTYDENTYAARYYAPAEKKSGKPEQTVTIYFTLDSSADHIVFTGEKIISSRTPDDTEIINYIHDMFYELNARRIKADSFLKKHGGNQHGNFMNSGTEVKDDFMQFGGKVSVIYDSTVPLFNIKYIENLSGKAEFLAVTAGRIQSESDTSFDDFPGFPDKYEDSRHTLKKERNPEKKEFTVENGQTVILDSMWKQAMENLWLCQDAAIISAGKTSQNIGKKDERLLLSRQLLQSTGNSYIDWSSIETNSTDDSCTVKAVLYQPTTKNVTVNIKNLKKTEGGTFFFTLTVFQNIYNENRRYFDSIINNYGIK